MPFFSRRRLQTMLDELADHVGSRKLRDLVKRLEDKRADHALPAEMELALIWAASRLGPVEVEPSWWPDRHRPEFYTHHLIPDRPCVIEVAGFSDGGLSGEKAMARIAQLVAQATNKVRRGVGDHLFFQFNQEMGTEDGRFFRRRHAPEGYELTQEALSAIKAWIRSGELDRKPLRITDAGLDVVIERKSHKQRLHHNYWCAMPAEAHHVEENPLFDLLKQKRKQIRAAPEGTLRLIVVADCGSRLLRKVGRGSERDPTGRTVSGSQIIQHFVNEYSEQIDSVVVLSARRDGALSWVATAFNSPGLTWNTDGFRRLLEFLPAPRFEGYQARSLLQQRGFSPAGRGWYLGSGGMFDLKRGQMKVSIPARALLDLLAGRVTVEEFRFNIGLRDDEPNRFKLWLDRGMTISDAQMEPRDNDEDDDHLTLIFSDDPAARMLRVGSS